MYQSYGFLAWLAAFGVAVTLSGCGSPTSQEKQKPAAPAENKAQEQPGGQGEHSGHTEHEGHQHDAHQGEHSGHEDHADHEHHTGAASVDVSKGLAELSDADRTAAEKQRVCPVSGDLLGSEGKPIKVTVKGKTVFLCCPDCEEAITKNPDKYLAKLKASET
jgi:YHS domain-containing protein